MTFEGAASIRARYKSWFKGVPLSVERAILMRSSDCSSDDASHFGQLGCERGLARDGLGLAARAGLAHLLDPVGAMMPLIVQSMT